MTDLIDAENNTFQPFSKQELDQIFKPDLAKTLKSLKQDNDQTSQQNRKKTLINTEKVVS